MKNLLVVLLLSITLFSCNKSDDNNNNTNNPFLTTPPVNLSLNLSLPEYNPLRFPGNSVIISNQGIKGIVVYSVNENFYTAFDLTDPNHVPNTCSRMDIIGIEASCDCGDDNIYDIITGQNLNDQSLYPMQQYRAERNGDVINVFN
ncbi:MAG: hypothetical protein L3J09_04315 [Flavobacteriaceae bacterium]|nr:hypothetical protein [Flavobacteriaceae bacterium]